MADDNYNPCRYWRYYTRPYEIWHVGEYEVRVLKKSMCPKNEKKHPYALWTVAIRKLEDEEGNYENIEVHAKDIIENGVLVENNWDKTWVNPNAPVSEPEVVETTMQPPIIWNITTTDSNLVTNGGTISSDITSGTIYNHGFTASFTVSGSDLSLASLPISIDDNLVTTDEVVELEEDERIERFIQNAAQWNDSDDTEEMH